MSYITILNYNDALLTKNIESSDCFISQVNYNCMFHSQMKALKILAYFEELIIDP
jgi:hypothetical protein